MSELLRQTSGMKILPSMNSWTVVAAFGSARLMVDQKGRVELRGGSKSDYISAREWISLFMHEAVPHLRRN
jgi:hypothetical protein